MKQASFLLIAVLVFSNLFAGNKPDLPPVGTGNIKQDTTGKNRLFDTDELLNIKLSGNLRDLFNDRGEKVQNHDLVVSYINENRSEVSVPATARTRGHFRKSSDVCKYPPLLLQFAKTGAAASSVFSDQTKLKLVMPCQGNEYVVKEWMVYRLYNLVTPMSLRARLVQVQLEDTKKKSNSDPFYGILLEEDQQMARRNNVVVVNKKALQPQQTENTAFLTMAVFQYLIGNTDWSVQYQQNIKFVAADQNAVPITVAYDFDHAGIVGAPYAMPAEALEMASVRERRYRGYCITDMSRYADVVTLYNHLKKEIYTLYASCPLLDDKYKKATQKYFDEFYAILNNPNDLQKQFGYPCDKSGTGNVVIRGLKKQ